MYNRYVPNSDGTMRRQSLPEPEPEKPKDVPLQPIRSDEGLNNLLSQFLPSNMDNTDFLIAVLLMLMSGDQDSQNNALLTLAFYLFM